MAGHQRPYSVQPLIPAQSALFFQDRKKLAQKRLPFHIDQNRGNGSQHKGVAAERLYLQPQCSQSIQVFLNQPSLFDGKFQPGRYEEGLAFDSSSLIGFLQPLIHDSLMGRMLIDEKEAVPVLAKDVGVVQLAENTGTILDGKGFLCARGREHGFLLVNRTVSPGRFGRHGLT